MSFHLLLAVPEGAAEPERHDELGHSDHNGTHIQVVAIHMNVAHHHVEYQQSYDQALHESIRDDTQHGR